jgi:hypothetical protein
MLFPSIAGQVPTLLAYLDPGSGSLLLQVMIAGLLSSMFFLKSSLVVVRASLGRMFKRHA